MRWLRIACWMLHTIAPGRERALDQVAARADLDRLGGERLVVAVHQHDDRHQRRPHARLRDGDEIARRCPGRRPSAARPRRRLERLEGVREARGVREGDAGLLRMFEQRAQQLRVGGPAADQQHPNGSRGFLCPSLAIHALLQQRCPLPYRLPSRGLKPLDESGLCDGAADCDDFPARPTGRALNPSNTRFSSGGPRPRSRAGGPRPCGKTGNPKLMDGSRGRARAAAPRSGEVD